jgi:hypothetical protein
MDSPPIRKIIYFDMDAFYAFDAPAKALALELQGLG